MVAVQSAFCLEMHQNEVFLFFKITIDTSTSKQFENIKKKKELGTWFAPRSQTQPIILACRTKNQVCSFRNLEMGRRMCLASCSFKF
jgi:hypothetical protein